MIISQISTATGRLTLAISAAPTAWKKAGKKWPSAIPATMQSATQAAAEYAAALRLFRHTSPNWDPPVVTVSAREARGLDRVWEIVMEHRACLERSGELAGKRREQQKAWFWNVLEDGLRARFLGRDDVRAQLPAIEAQVADGTLPPTEGARRLLDLAGNQVGRS
jgi:LAO/AO transport system kinase